MNLFQTGSFMLNSGMTSPLKIECDALDEHDWATLAYLVHSKFDFYDVVGVPTGGTIFADALKPYVSNRKADPFLLVDDVLTTGGSMERTRLEMMSETTDINWPAQIIGVVVFARNEPPPWIHAIFRMW